MGVARMARTVVAAVLLLGLVPSMAAFAEETRAGIVVTSQDDVDDAVADWEGFERVAGRTRWATATAIARESYPGWVGAHHVVVASGDDRAAADPLAAAGLCWYYDAPLLLASAGYTPSETLQVLREIKAVDPDVMVHVVGGPVSVPDARLAELRAVVGKTHVERLPYGNRYKTAAAIMNRILVDDLPDHPAAPQIALIANGADATKFFDALALSTISSSIGAPVLLVKKDECPAETESALGRLIPQKVLLAGGSNTITNELMIDFENRIARSAEVRRLSGRDRYDTALDIALYAVDQGWLDPGLVLFAAKLPDALTGAGLSGRTGAFMLMVPGNKVSTSIAAFLEANMDSYDSGKVLGGENSVTVTTYKDLRGFVDPGYDIVYRPTMTLSSYDSTPAKGTYPSAYGYVRDQFGLGMAGLPYQVAITNVSDPRSPVGGSGGAATNASGKWEAQADDGLVHAPGDGQPPDVPRGTKIKCVVTATYGGKILSKTFYWTVD